MFLANLLEAHFTIFWTDCQTDKQIGCSPLWMLCACTCRVKS